MAATKYEERSVEELRALASDRNIEGRSNMNKADLIAALRGEDSEPEAPPEPTHEVVQAPNTLSPQRVAKGDRLAQIETLIRDELAESPDTGDGSHVHLLGILNSVQGLRDSQRAWQHQTESPPTSEQARREATAQEVSAGA